MLSLYLEENLKISSGLIKTDNIYNFRWVAVNKSMLPVKARGGKGEGKNPKSLLY